MFHRHKWVEEFRRYDPPRQGNFTGLSYDLFERITYGQTVVNYVCECGKRSQDILLGRV